MPNILCTQVLQLSSKNRIFKATWKLGASGESLRLFLGYIFKKQKREGGGPENMKGKNKNKKSAHILGADSGRPERY